MNDASMSLLLTLCRQSFRQFLHISKCFFFRYEDIMPLAQNCTQIYVWHTMSFTPPFRSLDLSKYSDTNLPQLTNQKSGDFEFNHYWFSRFRMKIHNTLQFGHLIKKCILGAIYLWSLNAILGAKKLTFTTSKKEIFFFVKCVNFSYFL